jgi:hypothetical protein
MRAIVEGEIEVGAVAPVCAKQLIAPNKIRAPQASSRGRIFLLIVPLLPPSQSHGSIGFRCEEIIG